MRIISLKLLREFWDCRPDAEEPLRHWYKAATRARWKNIHDARETFRHADAVKTRGGETLTIFNIAGNRHRLIARIRYDFQLVNIRHVLTHREYEKEKWKE